MTYSNANNRKMASAKKQKNDEFYTLYDDVERGISFFKDKLNNKSVYCCCDTPESNFWIYLHKNFSSLGLSRLTCTYLNRESNSYKYEYLGGSDTNCNEYVKTSLKCNGDLFSAECVEILDEHDVVITNPPFSLLSDFLCLLIEHGKEFHILGNLNAIKYKNLKDYFLKGKIWTSKDMFNYGATHFYGKQEIFDPQKMGHSIKDGSFVKDGMFYWRVNGIRWITNIEPLNREPITLTKLYDENIYKTYDNYNAIECPMVKDIPINYDKIMGVPISFMDKYCPQQFELIDIVQSGLIIGDKNIYARIMIKRK